MGHPTDLGVALEFEHMPALRLGMAPDRWHPWFSGFDFRRFDVSTFGVSAFDVLTFRRLFDRYGPGGERALAEGLAVGVFDLGDQAVVVALFEFLELEARLAGVVDVE